MLKGIQLRVLLLTLLPVIVISTLLGSYTINNAMTYLKDHQQERAMSLITTLITKGEPWMLTENKHALSKLIQHKLTKEVIGIAFYNKQKTEIIKIGTINAANIIFTTTKSHPNIISTKNITFVSLPIFSPTIIGWLALELDNSTLHAEQYKMLLYSSSIILFGLIISCLLALKTSTKIINSILSMTNAVEKIKQGDLDVHIKTDANWELEILESGLNTMTSTLKISHEKLQQKIDEATTDLRRTLETIELQNIELKISRTKAENATLVKSEFLASMSHELRTPLNSIIGFINLLLKTNLNTRQFDYVTTIQKSANSLLLIVNDILDFSKIEAGKLFLDLELINIRECIEDALTLLAPSAHEKTIEIIPFFHSNVPEMVFGDQIRIKQILTNLVNNSIKFTEQGSVIIRVMLDEKQSNNKVTLFISVEDTGKGLTEEEQKGLFHSFDQLDPKITRKFGGTGLGLVICKRLIEQMHGTIQLTSTPDKGTTFWFTIEVEKNIDNNQKTVAHNKLQGLQVLLFEKHPVTRLAIINMLINWKMEVKEIDKLEEIPLLLSKVLELKTPYQLILIGINQLEENKFLLKQIININKNNCQSSCKIGVLVNTPDYLLHNERLIKGINLCLAKPLCGTKLYSALCNLFNENSLQYSHSQQLSILVVDDPANLKLIVALLNNIGAIITTAISGKDALLCVQQQVFSLILMDINMPGMDGIETAQAIRQGPTDNKDIPIVALSTHTAINNNTITQSLINDYISKPINENQLKATICKWIHHGIIKSELLTLEEILAAQTKELGSIDWTLSIQLAAGNLQLAKDLFIMLINDLPKSQGAINHAYQAYDWQDLRHHVHKLHGGCCYVGVPKLKFLAKTLELAIINVEHKQIKILLAEINKEITFIINSVDNIQGSLPTHFC